MLLKVLCRLALLSCAILVELVARLGNRVRWS